MKHRHLKPSLLRRRRYQTLIEVLIAMVLTALILVTLNFFYREVDALNTYMEGMQNESFHMRYLENRLADILPKIVSRKSAKKNFVFFTSTDTGGVIKPGSDSLVFIYNNKIDITKEFSNNTLGRLYLDKKNRLCMATWPLPSRWTENVNPPVKKEVLLENVDHIAFEFYIPPDRKRGEEESEPLEPVAEQREASEKTLENMVEEAAAAEPVEPEPKGEWIETWLNEYAQLPGIIRVKVTLLSEKDKNKILVFSFPLPNSQKHIVYER